MNKMVIQSIMFNFQEEMMEEIGFKWQKIRICELGAQVFRPNPMAPEKIIAAKKFYIEEKGVLKHISIDLTGSFGSLILNLCRPVPKIMINKFHLITDYGTSEHVNNQYQVFKNVHDMCRVNGMMIHTLPIPNNFKNHCRYYYPKDFFTELARLCGYKILKLEIKNAYTPPRPKSDLIFITLLKHNNNDFISKKSFKNLNLIDTKDISRTGNYSMKNKNIIPLWGATNYLRILIPGKKYLKIIFKTAQRLYVDLRNS